MKFDFEYNLSNNHLKLCLNEDIDDRVGFHDTINLSHCSVPTYILFDDEASWSYSPPEISGVSEIAMRRYCDTYEPIERKSYDIVPLDAAYALYKTLKGI